ncbi:MAG: DEAD/DEAH box helicase family protein [Lachnospiraceae bacterium]|nr:DEAD/DEAH box helicase family protein [Lachnospiraceae bacterium]
MTNFDYLKKEKQFDSFSEVAISSEKLLPIDREACVINCRRAMEFAVKWLYSVDASLQKPYQDNLHSLMSTEEFRALVDKGLWRRMDLIRKMGNRAAHAGAKITFDEASLCLQNLFIFLDFVACCYAKEYEERQFDLSLFGKGLPDLQAPHRTFADVDLQALIEENKALKAELTKRRENKHPAYVPKPLDLSEYKTRKIYIDFMLRDAGWVEGQNWLNEVKIEGMPNQSGKGYADYVLYDDAHKPLAVIEAKSTCEDVARGRQQAKLYADILEQKYQRRPVIFLTNGFDTRIIDGQYPERQVSGVYSKRDLEKWFNLRSERTSLKNIVVDQKIAGRYYQEAAIRAVCDSFGEGNRRKALLVMATGAGKTRTVIALCKALMHAGWIRNVLFLADRNSLITQAKRSFVNQFTEELSVVNVVEEKNNYHARCVFSTYQTMIHLIDDAVDQEGKIFSCGHFDLVICDEAHRSIYNKYKDIFTYFDALLVGLTATPKEDIDKNTYSIFDLEDGVPTYGYDLAQAVTDGFLVDYLSVESEVKFIEQGIAYDELSQEDREAYENTFKDENGNFPERIQSSAINKWLFNEDTIKQVLRVVMNEGLKTDYGQKLGKTIIFAVNHNHAEKIFEIFNKEYPYLSKNGQDFAKVIDNRTAYVQKAIDEFAEAGKLPQIAISVDMLDTGIDVPEVLNLVFFKKVLSRAKFWQMIGRGTRLCPGLLDGEDKQKFYIFDFCGNFAFFRVNEGKPTANQMALQSAIFNLEFQIAYKLQDASRQVNRLIAYREKLVRTMSGKVQELNRESFAVRQHLKHVEMYSDANGYQSISYEDTQTVREELAPLILPDQDEAGAVRFDALMYGMELAYLSDKTYTRAKGDLRKHVKAIAGVANIPEIQVKTDLIQKILQTGYVDDAGIDELEYIREELRGLMKYIPQKAAKYETNFADDILSTEWYEAELESSDLKNYKEKAEYYIRQNQNHIAIVKLRGNKPLSDFDVQSLEEILWGELGTREDYEREYGEKPLGEFVREIVGLDMNAAKEAFAEYLNGSRMDSRQIYFVNQIVEYIVHNGLLKDFSVLQQSPFTDKGSVVEIFTDMDVWTGIREVIEQINANAMA